MTQYPNSFLEGISQQAVNRVIDRLPIPKHCPFCLGEVILKSHPEVYVGRSFGAWPWVYACTRCDAYVGLHSRTDIPLGTLADYETRGARSKAKSLFLHRMKMEGLTRTEAYTRLAEQLGIPKRECHFGWFTASQCYQVVKLLRTKVTDHD